MQPQVQREFYAVATGKLLLSHQAALEIVDHLSAFATTIEDATFVLDAIALSRSHRISYWDASIIWSANLAGCERLLTEDLDHGAVIAGVRIENPFIDVDIR